MHPFVNTAITAARAAGNIITRAMDNPAKIKVQSKGALDYVTDIDQKAEQTIISLINKAYPTHGFLGEESGEVIGKDKDMVWIIDPLDGTTNFIHGFPHCCVAIALRVKGRVEHGVIYDPIRQDMFSASRGQGAQVNNHRLRVSHHMDLSQALVAFNFTRPDTNLDHHLAMIKALTGKVAAIRHGGSAALDLAYVAAGWLDAFWHSGLQPWDMAAGGIIASEAGALVTDSHGGGDYLSSGEIVAANPKLLKHVLLTLKKTSVSSPLKPDSENTAGNS